MKKKKKLPVREPYGKEAFLPPKKNSSRRDDVGSLPKSNQPSNGVGTRYIASPESDAPNAPNAPKGFNSPSTPSEDSRLKTEDPAPSPCGEGRGGVYLALVALAFATLTAIFLFFPRSTYSTLEKRDLSDFPDPARFKESPTAYTEAISSWFSDTEPYRDELMTLSMTLRAAMKSDLRSDADAISFRPSSPSTPSEDSRLKTEDSSEDLRLKTEDSSKDSRLKTEDSTPSGVADGVAKLASSGTIVVGKGPNVRALMAFGGTPKGGGAYVDLLNTLAETFPNQKVYAMVAPLATEFYLPAKAAKASSPQKPFIYSIRDRLSPKVKFVDLYDEMNKHKNEDIYLRTDHHWSPLGGHYAARRLAQTAGVPFRNLDAYDKHVIHKFVGTMYGYSKDIAVKNAPEDFVYYTPNQVDYDSEFVSYFLNKNYQIIRETKPYKAPFFKKFKDGSSGAYLTFMGSDQATVKVRTSTPGKRKLLLIKDSYGNAVPGNLFYSFPEVHIIDFRYFTQNLKDYVSKNGITDIAVCFNVFNAFSASSSSKVKKFLTQKEGINASNEQRATRNAEPPTQTVGTRYIASPESNESQLPPPAGRAGEGSQLPDTLKTPD